MCLRFVQQKTFVAVVASVFAILFIPLRTQAVPMNPSLPHEVHFGEKLTHVVAGTFHTCVLSEQGGVYCWGRNDHGQLGDGTTTDRSTPVPVSGLTEGIQTLSAGGAATCALHKNGHVLCWGENTHGSLGDGSTTDRRTPVTVVGLPRATAISTSGVTTCALIETGAVRCWGRIYTDSGFDRDDRDYLTPVSLLGWENGIAAISIGCVLAESGEVSCGAGVNIPAEPFDTVGEQVKALVTLDRRSGCAITESGSAKCWGNNFFGQLGNGFSGNHNSSEVPVQVIGLEHGVKLIQGGAQLRATRCAINAEDALFCWGSNQGLILGLGFPSEHFKLSSLPTGERYAAAPLAVANLDEGVLSVAIGGAHACAITLEGKAKCWGDNYYGQLGDSFPSNYGPIRDSVSQYSISHRSLPVSPANLKEGITALASATDFTCILTEGRQVQCWGENESGQLGDGTTRNRLEPAPVQDLPNDIIALATQSRYSCAVSQSLGVRCWGGNANGTLGDGTTITRTLPVAPKGLPTNVVGLTTSGDGACALTAGGAVYCWGGNAYGQLGNGTNADSTIPVLVRGLGSGVRQLMRTCALTDAGGVLCWGYNGVGSLGDGTTISRNEPVQVLGLESGVAKIVEGGLCAITDAGALWCWGPNDFGQVGNGTTEAWDKPTVPTPVVGLESGVVAATATGRSTCALTDQGAVYCWGDNYSGNIGDGTSDNYRSVPTLVEGLGAKAKSLAVMPFRVCALTITDEVFCWGDTGPIGSNDAPLSRLRPFKVPGLGSVLHSLLISSSITCVRRTGRALWCWGRNSAGELGFNPGFMPLEVRFNEPAVTKVNLVLTSAFTPGVDEQTQGGTMAYTAQVVNSGNQPLFNVSFAFTVPEGTEFTAGVGTLTVVDQTAPSAWTCPNGTPAGAKCTATLGTIAAGSNVRLTFAVRVVAAVTIQDIQLRASVSTEDANGIPLSTVEQVLRGESWFNYLPGVQR